MDRLSFLQSSEQGVPRGLMHIGPLFSEAGWQVQPLEPSLSTLSSSVLIVAFFEISGGAALSALAISPPSHHCRRLVRFATTPLSIGVPNDRKLHRSHILVLCWARHKLKES